MIRPIDIRLNAAHPDIPLAEAVTYTGAPSTVLVRGVPGNCGRWAITAVFVAATFPDGSTSTRTAVQSANGVWVATLPATATSGRTAHGLRILADGADENGEAVGGYVLGVADFAVASLGISPAPEPGETSWQMLYFDAVPGVLRKGDVAKVNGVLKFYNGTAWEAFANVPAPSTANPAMDGTAAPGTSAAFARGDHVHPTDTSRVPTSRKVNGKALSADVTLTGADIAVSRSDPTKISAALANKATKADATLTEHFSAWTLSGDVEAGSQYDVRFDYDFDGTILWGLYEDGDPLSTGSDNPLSTSEDFSWGETYGEYTITATRTALQGYQLGSQTDKPLASEAEAEALRTGKANRAANPTAGNLAVLDANGNPTDSGVKASDKLDASSASAPFSSESTVQYAVGEHCTYDGKLYKCTTATTGGTWDASKWTADTMTDPDAVLDITAQNQLRVVAKDGTVLWAQGYDLASTSSATLACDATNNFTFADGATTQAFTLPTAPTGKVGDFGLDIDNSANTGAATMTLTGLDTTFSVVVPEGESLNDMLAIAAGELARFYITLSTFRVNNLPTWHVVKQVVENGGAQS